MAKTGAHIALGPRSNYGLFCTSKPAVCIAVDDGGALLEAKQNSSGHTITIFRDTSVYLEAPPDFNTHPDMTALARAWYPALKAKWLQNPADYYTITNEIGGGDGPDVPGNLTRLVAYEKEIMRLANLDGFAVCVLNHATGSPGDFNVWKAISAPFIVQAWQDGNIYGRHVYGDGDLVDSSGNVLPGGPIRPFQELDYLRSLGAAGGVALTEVGLDGGFNYPGKQRTVEQMAGYEQALRLADEIIGLCWWTLGTHQSAANWQDALPAVALYNSSNPTPAWEWPDNPDDPEEPTMQVKSFEDGWTDDPTAPSRRQIPNGFTVSVIPHGQPLRYGNAGNATGTIEAKHLRCPNHLPPHECAGQPKALILDEVWTYKMQAVVMKSGTSLKTTFEGSGRKRITVPIQVHWQSDSPNDPHDVYVGVYLNGELIKLLQHPELKDRQWHHVTGEADGPVEVEVHYQTSWDNSRDCWTDYWTCEDLEGEPMTWEQQLAAAAESKKVLAFKKGASLQMRITADGFQARTNEFDSTLPDGTTPIVCRGAIHPATAEIRVYYAPKSNYSNVQYIVVSGGASTPSNPS